MRHCAAPRTSLVVEVPVVSELEVVRPRLRSFVRLLSELVVSSMDSWAKGLKIYGCRV